MSNISNSPKRFTFQRDNYIKGCEEQGIEPNKDLLEMYNNWKAIAEEKFEDPSSRVDNLEYDLLTTEWILEKVRSNESYAQNLYAAMCNNEFVKNDVWPILSDDRWSVSWRSAGGIIADMRQEGDYIDWYCSGISQQGVDMAGAYERQLNEGFVPESHVTDEIREDLVKLGWIIKNVDK